MQLVAGRTAQEYNQRKNRHGAFWEIVIMLLRSKIPPEIAYLVLGTRERFPVRLANVSAYFRRLQDRFRDAIAARSQTLPYPCDHCLMCGFQSNCEARWEREDHLVRVAGIRRDQVNRLTTAGLTTLYRIA